jgi:hypothetical protein
VPFIILTFWGGAFCHQSKFAFLKSAIKFPIYFLPSMTYFKENSYTSQKGHFPNFSTQEPKKKRHKRKKNAFSKIVLGIFCRFKT